MPAAFCWALRSCLAADWPRNRRRSPPSAPPSAPSARSFQGSVTKGEASAADHRSFARRRHPARPAGEPGHHFERHADGRRRARERLSQLQSLLPSVDFAAKEADDANRSARRGPAHPRLSHHHRALRLYRPARLAQLVAGQRGFAAQLPGRAPQLCRRAIVGAGRARPGGAHRGQRLSARAGR